MMNALKGFRTYLVMLPVIVLSLLDQLGAIDLKSALMALGLTEAYASAAPGLVALLAVVLRTMTTSAPGKSE